MGARLRGLGCGVLVGVVVLSNQETVHDLAVDASPCQGKLSISEDLQLRSSRPFRPFISFRLPEKLSLGESQGHRPVHFEIGKHACKTRSCIWCRYMLLLEIELYFLISQHMVQLFITHNPLLVKAIELNIRH